MIRKLFIASALLFGIGLNIASAQEVVSGPKDHEKLTIEHATVCSSSADMDAFLAENDYYALFSGKNDIASLSAKDKPSTSYADIHYSAKMKSVITIIYDKNIACILSGISDPKVMEKGINVTLGIKN